MWWTDKASPACNSRSRARLTKQARLLLLLPSGNATLHPSGRLIASPACCCFLSHTRCPHQAPSPPLHHPAGRNRPVQVPSASSDSYSACAPEGEEDGAGQKLLHLDGECIFFPSFYSPSSPATDHPRDVAWPWPPIRTRQSARRGTRALAVRLQRHGKRRLNAIYGNKWTSRRHTSTRACRTFGPAPPRLVRCAILQL
jgi:hypothetical protein